MATIQMLDHPLQTIFTDRVVVSGRILELLSRAIPLVLRPQCV